MNIEYLPGIQPGAKVDLEKLDKFKKPVPPEHYRPALKEKLREMPRSVNEQYKQDFLDDSGRIVVRGQDADKDNEYALGREIEWAKEKGLDLPEWREDKEKGSGTIAEMAMTVFLNKVLSEGFIVARASDFDDYKNGIDHVIIDKKTGVVICGFDEVVDDTPGYYAIAKKQERMKKIVGRGGSEIKYGATIEDGELVRRSFQNVPTFYVALSTAELSELAAGLETGEPGISASETKTFNKLTLSLQEQSSKLATQNSLNRDAKAAISSLITAFDRRQEHNS